MKFKLAPFWILGLSTALLSAYLALWPIFGRKNFDEHVVAKSAVFAARNGFLEVAEAQKSRLLSEKLRRGVDAQIALFKFKNGENVDLSAFKGEDFKAEILIEKMLSEKAEGESGAFLFEQKYAPLAAGVKDSCLRAECFYRVFLATNNKKYSDYAFGILRGERDRLRANKSVLKIASLALESGNFEDFIRFLNLADKKTWDTDLAAFKILQNERFCALVSAEKDKRKFFHYYPNLFLSLNYLKKGDTKTLANRTFIYYSCHIPLLNFYAYRETTYPIIAYVALLKGEDKIYGEFKSRSVSEDTLRRVSKGYGKYLRFAAAVFAECGDWQTSLELAAKAESAFSELRILDAVIDRLPPDEAAAKAVCARVNYLTGARAKLERAY